MHRACEWTHRWDCRTRTSRSKPDNVKVTAMIRNSALLVLASCVILTGRPATADDIDFGRDIRPILSNACFQCHGPDDDTREADLRLDRESSLFADRDGVAAVVRGNPDRSEIMVRILSQDPDTRMPPPSSKKVVKPDQVELLRRWIEQGASWNSHWSFVVPTRPDPPPARDPSWPRNSIDHFVLARLQQAGLTPSVPAEPLTLVRRLYLDLTGLPPEPEEADRWVRALTAGSGAEDTASIDERQLERLVDELLSSPRYGERWARRWLDLARYADTNGYEKDRERQIWPYRDWVVDAINRDMPFDQFTIEQIAGDMLPDATQSQRVATGFHRNTMMNEEGGIDPLEFRYYAMTDRVATTGTVWLGLTTGCAQCHTHKYDPITQTDYYGLMAFLNNADEVEIGLSTPARESARRDQLARAEQLLKELPKHWPVAADAADPEQDRNQRLEEAFDAWLTEQRKQTVEWRPISPFEATSNLPLLTVEEDHTVFVSGDTTKQDEFLLRYRPGSQPITAIRLEALPDPRLPDHGPGLTYYEGTKGDFFLGEFQVLADGEPIPIASATQTYANNRFGSNPVSAELATDGDPQTGWSVHGRMGERHVAVFVLDRPLESLDELQLKMMFGRHYASTLGRFRISVTSQPGGGVAREFTNETELLLARDQTKLSSEQLATLRSVFLMHAPELSKQAAEIRKLRSAPDWPTTLVFQERPANHPRPTFRHHRGEYLQTREQIAPRVPEFLHDFPADVPANRLEFARWLVSDQNPLTPRVVVNRHWAALFGKGLVRTVDDFGLQGEPPTHPQLLDWLATEFVRSGWSLKHMHRLMVLSSTYRQSSVVRPELLQKDPGNRLLSRASRFRLEAEIIRDSSLLASGLLSLKQGGPPVRPSQPAGVTEVAFGSPKWNVSAGDDRFRRSLYTFQKRTAPFALFQTFDSPSGESCVARRDVSNTALQALSLLNDVVFVETARGLGKLAKEQAGDDEARIRFAFRRVLTRAPEPPELAMLQQFVDQQRARLTAGELDPVTLSGAPDAGRDDQIELAAWTTLARALFGLDEAITRN